MADNSEQIAQNALAPKRVQGDEGTVEQHPIADQIAADRYKRSQQATAAGWPVRRFKMTPPSAD